MIPVESLPALNATLNGLAAILLVVGWALIKRRWVRAHKATMIAALAVSALFLASYLYYHFNIPGGSRPFPGRGAWRALYFAVLVPHILLAIGMLPMIAVTFTRAIRGRIEAHRRIARWTLPIWLYVSVTGVIVYVMLYRMRW